MFIDAVVVKGSGKSFNVSVNVLSATSTESEPEFVALDLDPYAVQFRILGATTSDAKVLVEHLITQNTEPSEDGQITNPQDGQFTFTVTAEDTNKLGFGKFPIQINMLDAETLQHEFTLTEGGENSEFNCVRIVQV